MAVTEVQVGRTARVVLNNGTDSQGNPLTVNLTISGLSNTASDWDAAKFINILDALEPCLSKTVSDAQTVVTNSIRVEN